MTARWMCITALGAGLALGACDRGKPPSAERAPERTEAAEPTGAPQPAEAPANDEARPVEAPEPRTGPADAGTAAADAGTAAAGGKRPKGSKGAKGKCGGVGGLRCTKSEKCRYGEGAFAPTHPDAMGTCVDQSYCDAPPDCEGLMHIMVVGKWACEKNRCAWKAEGGSGPM